MQHQNNKHEDHDDDLTELLSFVAKVFIVSITDSLYSLLFIDSITYNFKYVKYAVLLKLVMLMTGGGYSNTGHLTVCLFVYLCH